MHPHPTHLDREDRVSKILRNSWHYLGITPRTTIIRKLQRFNRCSVTTTNAVFTRGRKSVIVHIIKGKFTLEEAMKAQRY